MSAIEINIDPMTMPVCPLCDNGITTFEPVVLVTAQGAMGLAHQWCVEEIAEDQPETPIMLKRQAD